jgi:hypothetical protein
MQSFSFSFVLSEIWRFSTQNLAKISRIYTRKAKKKFYVMKTTPKMSKKNTAQMVSLEKLHIVGPGACECRA